MNINRLILFFASLIYMVAMTLPANADVITISFKPTVKHNNCMTTSENRNTHCYSPRKVGKFTHPKMGGLRVDACVYSSDSGWGWRKSNLKRCDANRLDIIANDFCKSKGYKKSILVAKGSHKGKHATLTFKKGKSNNSFWKRRNGSSAIDSIYCE